MSNKIKCDKKTVALSFLYLEHLEKEGVLKNLTNETIEYLIERNLAYLSKVFKDKFDYLKNRNEFPNMPTVNVISKDYFSTVDYKEEFTEPNTVVLNKNFNVKSIYDVEYSTSREVIDISELEKDNTLNLKYNIKDKLYFNENEVISFFNNIILASKLFNEAERKIGQFVNENDELDMLEPFFRRSRQKDINHSLLLLESFGFKAEDNNIVEKIAQLLEENSAITKLIYPLHDFGTDLKSTIEEILNQKTDNRLSPLYIDTKQIEGLYVSRDEIVKTFKESVLATIKSSSEFKVLNEVQKNLVLEFNNQTIDCEVVKDAVDYAFDEIRKTSIDVYERVMLGYFNQRGLLGYKKMFINNVRAVYVEPLLTAIEKLSSKTNKTFELDIINKYPNIITVEMLPIATKEEIISQSISVNIDIPNEKDITKFDKINISPKTMRVGVVIGSNTQKSIMEFKTFNNVDESLLMKNAIRNTSNKTIRMSADYIKDFDDEFFDDDVERKDKRTIFINDEADEKAGGETANAIALAVKKHSSAYVIATGTPATKAGQIVKLTKSALPLENVRKIEAEFEKLYGMSEINSIFIALIASNVAYDKELMLLVEDSYAEWDKAKKNIEKIIEQSVQKLVNLMIEKEYFDDETVSNLSISALEKELIELFKGIKKVKKEKINNLGFDKLLDLGLSSTESLLRKQPKISSLKSFASAFSTLIGKNAVSSTSTGVEKSNRFLNSRDITINFNKKSPQITVQKFIEKNRVEVRVIQALTSIYPKLMFLNDSYAFLTENFKFFISNFKKQNLKSLTSFLNQNQVKTINFNSKNHNHILAMMDKSTTTANDDFISLYRKMIKNNGSIDGLFEKGADEPTQYQKERKELFEYMLSFYKEYLELLPQHHLEVMEIIENSKTKKIKSLPIEMEYQGVKYSFDGSYSYQHLLSNQMYNTTLSEYVIKNLNEKAYPTNLLFSVIVDICPKDLRELLAPNQDGKYLPYKLELLNKDENKVLDILSTKGFQEKVKEQLKDGLNGVMTNSRTMGQVLSFLNTYKAYIEISREYDRGELSEETKINFEKFIKDNLKFVLVKTANSSEHFDIKDIFGRVKFYNNVELELLKRNVIENTVNKNVNFDKKTVWVAGTAPTISRGINFSYLHRNNKRDGIEKTAIINFIDPEVTNDGIQVLSRLDSPTVKENIISLANGGADAKIYLFGEKGFEITKNIMKKATLLTSSMENKYTTVQNIFEEIIRDSSVSNPIFKYIISNMNLKVPFGISEVASNALKMEIAKETYESVMGGTYTNQNEEDIINTYIKTPLVNISKISSLPDIPNDNIDTTILEENKEKPIELKEENLDKISKKPKPKAKGVNL